jgi:peptidoglycan-associated lipoprotein
MKWKLAGVLAVLAFETNVPPADACGIKLVIKTSTPHKAVARSSNPSHLLLLGTPPHRLERELSAAGHDVEVEPNAAAAKRTSYAVVIVDEKQADETRAKFTGAVVIVRSGDVTADIASIEGQVARKPVRTDESRPLVAARADRKPVAAGPAVPSHPIVAAKPPEVTAPSPVPTPAPAATPTPAPTPAPTPPRTPAVVATVQPPPVEHPAPVPPREPVVKQPKTVAVVAVAPKPAGAFHDELYFGVGSATIGRKVALDRAARWLTDSASIQVVIEGYADPTGTHEANQALGQSRAESVRDYLVAAGIDATRLEVISYGDTRLKYSHNDSRNRRVAIVPKP